MLTNYQTSKAQSLSFPHMPSDPKIQLSYMSKYVLIKASNYNGPIHYDEWVVFLENHLIIVCPELKVSSYDHASRNKSCKKNVISKFCWRKFAFAFLLEICEFLEGEFLISETLKHRITCGDN